MGYFCEGILGNFFCVTNTFLGVRIFVTHIFYHWGMLFIFSYFVLNVVDFLLCFGLPLYSIAVFCGTFLFCGTFFAVFLCVTIFVFHCFVLHFWVCDTFFWNFFVPQIV